MTPADATVDSVWPSAPPSGATEKQVWPSMTPAEGTVDSVWPSAAELSVQALRRCLADERAYREVSQPLLDDAFA